MTRRIFLGIGLKLELNDLRAKLSSFNKSLNWIPDENLNIPLNYLGRLAHQDINEVGKTIKTIVDKYSQFTLKPLNLQTLYKKHEESMINIELDGDLNVLMEMQKELTLNLDEVAAQPKRYFPYITIATLKKTDHDSTKKLLSQVNDLNIKLNMDDILVTKVSTFETLFYKDSVTYHKLRDFTLRSQVVSLQN